MRRRKFLKRKWISLLFLLFAILSGCQGSGNQKEQIAKGDTGFITDLEDHQILIKSTYFKITDTTRIQDLDGNQLTYADVKVGMKVKPWYEGDIKESFPSKAQAKLLIVLTDSETVAEQKAVASAIKHVTVAASQRFMVLHLTHVEQENVYKIEMMNRSNLDTSFTVLVDDQTDKVLDQY